MGTYAPSEPHRSRGVLQTARADLVVACGCGGIGRRAGFNYGMCLRNIRSSLFASRGWGAHTARASDRRTGWVIPTCVASIDWRRLVGVLAPAVLLAVVLAPSASLVSPSSFP